MKINFRIYLLLVFLSLTVCAFSTRSNANLPPPIMDEREDIAAVKSAFEKLVQGFNAQDSQVVMSLFARDVILSYADQPDSGYDTIKTSFEKMFVPRAGLTRTWTTEIEEIKVSGDMAYSRVIWTLDWKLKNPEKQRHINFSC